MPPQPSSAALQRCSKKRPHPGCFFVMLPTTGAPSGTHRHQRFRCTRLSGPVTGVALVVLPFTTVVHPRTHCQQHLFVVWMYRRLLGRPPTSECRRDRLRATDRLCPARRPPTIPPTRERMSSLASSRVCSSWSAANNPSTRLRSSSSVLGWISTGGSSACSSVCSRGAHPTFKPDLAGC